MNLKSDYTAAAGRVALSLIFVISGLAKLASPETTVGYIASANLPFPVFACWRAAALEIVGGVALIIGLKARATAAALAVFSIVTAILFHSQFSDQNQMIHFLKNIAIMGGLLQIAAFGAGAISVDARNDCHALRPSAAS
jgi:putative oxidoreductase